MKSKWLFLGSALFCMQQASAHASWVAERLDTPTIIYGHGASDNAYAGKTLSVLLGLDQKGSKIDLEAQQHEKNITLKVDDKHFAAAYVFDNGYWTKDKAGKWHNLPKNEVANAETAVHSVKTAVAVFKEHAKIDAAALNDLKLVLLPLGDAVHSHQGETLKVQVLFEGKALAGAKIIGDYVGDSDRTAAVSDENGMAEIQVRNNGLNVFAVGHKVKLAQDAKADAVSYTATLSFTNANHHH